MHSRIGVKPSQYDIKSFMETIQTIAFDADDTLWHNQNLFDDTHIKFRNLLARYCDGDTIDALLLKTETANLRYYGYSAKGFALSLIETALFVSENRISGDKIAEILKWVKAMKTADIGLLEGVRETLAQLASVYSLLLITKGDLFDQEGKLARSGIGDYFFKVEIVSDKTPAVYKRILSDSDCPASAFVMVGNSLRSDILPVLELGCRAVYIPYSSTWAHEVVELPEPLPSGFVQLNSITQLPAALSEWQ